MSDNEEVRLQGIELLDDMEPILDMVDGFRAKCNTHGYSPEVSEQMALVFFQTCMRAQNFS